MKTNVHTIWGNTPSLVKEVLLQGLILAAYFVSTDYVPHSVSPLVKTICWTTLGAAGGVTMLCFLYTVFSKNHDLDSYIKENSALLDRLLRSSRAVILLTTAIYYFANPLTQFITDQPITAITIGGILGILTLAYLYGFSDVLLKAKQVMAVKGETMHVYDGFMSSAVKSEDLANLLSAYLIPSFLLPETKIDHFHAEMGSSDIKVSFVVGTSMSSEKHLSWKLFQNCCFQVSSDLYKIDTHRIGDLHAEMDALIHKFAVIKFGAGQYFSHPQNSNDRLSNKVIQDKIKKTFIQNATVFMHRNKKVYEQLASKINGKDSISRVAWREFRQSVELTGIPDFLLEDLQDDAAYELIDETPGNSANISYLNSRT